MDVAIKAETAQPVFSDIPEANNESAQKNGQNNATPGTHATRATAEPAQDATPEEWAAPRPANSDIERIASYSTTSSSSGDTHISAGSALNSYNPPHATPSTLPDESERPLVVPDVLPKTDQQTPRSHPIISTAPTSSTSSPSHISRPLPSSQPILFNSSQPASSSASTPLSGHITRVPVPRPAKGPDPLPSHLRALLQDFYERRGTSELPPCALVSDNKQSIYIFPGGKKAKYVNRQGDEVGMRRVQLPESGFWVSIVEPRDRPAVLVKRLPKYGPTPGFGGTSLFIWNGLTGFDQHPSFFKVAVEGETPADDPYRATPPPAKRIRLSESSGHAQSSSGNSEDPRQVPASQGHSSASRINSRPTVPGEWMPRQYHGPGNSPKIPDGASTPTHHPSYMNSSTPSTPAYTPPFPSSAYPPVPWPQPQPYPQHQYYPGSQYAAYPPANATPPNRHEYATPSNHAVRKVSDAPSDRSPTQSTVAKVGDTEAPSGLPGILSPDRKSRTILNFVGGSRPRSRPFTSCDTVDKLFVQAAAAGFKGFSLSAATFVMVKVRRRGLATEGANVQEVAVVKGDEVDFKQLQEVIRDVGDWTNLSDMSGVDCEVSTVE